MVLAVLPMVELVEVAEGVLEPSDHLGTHSDRFLFKIKMKAEDKSIVDLCKFINKCIATFIF